MSRRLLDTDILSEVIKGKNQNVATSAANYLAQHGRLTISAVSVAEIIHEFRRKGGLRVCSIALPWVGVATMVYWRLL